MNLSRKQILDEMGLSPQWALRDESGITRREKKIADQSSARQPKATKALTAEGSERRVALDDSPESMAERAGQIDLMDWEALRQNVSDCRACGLCAERKPFRRRARQPAGHRLDGRLP